MKTCVACGMPMNNPEDFAMKDESKDYCQYCQRPDGSMQSYLEKLEGTTHFLMKTQGLEEHAARETAIRLMKKLPAWANI